MKFTLPTGLIGMMICFFLPGQFAQAQRSTNFTPLNFTENKGQWEKEVLYKTDLDGAVIYLKKSGFTFLMYSQQDMYALNEYVHGHSHRADTVFIPGNINYKTTAQQGEKPPPRPSGQLPDVRGHAYNVTFLNANPDPEVVPEKAQEAISNYFIGNDRSKWASNVKSFQGINYNSIYPGIDAHIYSDASQLKYDLIIQPGANPDKIQLSYEGPTGMELKKGQLYIHTSVGDVIEQLPFAYQFINNERVTVKVSYRLNDNKIGFKISGDYNPAYPLVIDPAYVFSTVSGSRSDNWGFTATYDDAGNFYGGGIVFGNGYPVTPGAVQSVFNGDKFDIGISKFSANGNRLIYATYVGGNGLEQPHSLFVDPQGELVISGRTTSTNYPADALLGPRGGWDIAITKLNATGTGIIGSLVIGGSADDGVNMRENREGGDWVLLRNYGDDARSEVVIDNAGYIYVASCTRSKDFPVTPGVFQGQNNGLQDGVVLKINPLCKGLVWASYLGGSKEDAAYVIALNGLNTLYVAGGTASTDFPVKGGVVYPNYRGGVCDGFIAHIANDGSAILQATYLGSDDAAADQVYGIQLDKNGYVYVMGTTEGTWPIKLLSANSYNNNSLQFITKLQPDLSSLVYSTTFGKSRNLAGTPAISPVAFLVDRCENVYVSGWGGGINTALHYPNSGTTGMPITPDALQRTTDGMDFYFFVLKRDGISQLYGSYFGGSGLYEHVDGGTSRFDRNGIIYQGICAWCNVNANGTKPRYPTTPGAYSSTPPPGCNFGALKIAFNLDGVKAGIKTLDRRKNYCVPETITFVDTTNLPADKWEWTFDDGSAPEIGRDTIKHTFTKVGTYHVRLVKFDQNTCNFSDTAYIDVKLGTNRADLQFTGTRQAPCDSLKYLFLNNSTPAGQFTDSSFILNMDDGSAPAYVGPTKFPYIHYFKTAGTYNVTLTLIDTNFCNAPQTITLPLRVAINVTALFNVPDTVCVGATLQMDNVSLGGESFQWSFSDDNSTSTAAYPVHTFSKAGPCKIKLVVVDPNTCNKIDSITKIILVAPPPKADFDYSPTKPIENTPVTFINTSIGADHYLWNFGDGDTSSAVNPQHQYLKTNSYSVCLTATNKEGCTDTKCSPVSAIVVPLFDVPTAFAPNGLNKIFYVKAFGATKFNLKIFNRWGQLVFESSDPRIGWDGRFKGNLQPMDAYAYIVNLEFTDGTKGNRSGSVTLLR
ncbi:gliding motility-associated-like protein [Chitinophaga niastensis]|uniref:Gliding motility-associated-like protein n=1 Tax=Chitinophaga niastensis TaxID=536980 RepID=A0A2P8HVC9_CHINA|nr:PKD domain-containing protein [Chitinophaga niastensis]PSL50187.1 gliding motility-associated-like protein [Chitinophaga niastensis]